MLWWETETGRVKELEDGKENEDDYVPIILQVERAVPQNDAKLSFLSPQGN